LELTVISGCKRIPSQIHATARGGEFVQNQGYDLAGKKYNRGRWILFVPFSFFVPEMEALIFNVEKNNCCRANAK
jgi:hypothetical protein